MGRMVDISFNRLLQGIVLLSLFITHHSDKGNLFNVELSSSSVRKFFSLCFIIILLSPFGAMPFYVTSHWGIVFAQEMNNQTTTQTLDPQESTINNTTATTENNATDIMILDTEPIDANYTAPLDGNYTEPIDANYTAPLDGNYTEPIDANYTSDNTINPTESSLVEEPITSLEDIPKIDLLATVLQNDTTSENATDNKYNMTLSETDDFLLLSEEQLNNNLDQVTFSAWVKPNYNGSDELTVVSKESSFVLSINNILAPEHVAKFSIFDGISWTDLTGSSKIENWTHLAVVKNYSSISLYINATQEGETTIPDTFVISEGQIDTITAQVTPSESNIVIGAYLSNTRGTPKLSNHFLGSIDEVIVFKSALQI